MFDKYKRIKEDSHFICILYMTSIGRKSDHRKLDYLERNYIIPQRSTLCIQARALSSRLSCVRIAIMNKYVSFTTLLSARGSGAARATTALQNRTQFSFFMQTAF
jgi:hypothetical protein